MFDTFTLYRFYFLFASGIYKYVDLDIIVGSYLIGDDQDEKVDVSTIKHRV